CPFYAQDDILQDLRVHLSVLATCRVQIGQCCLLLVVGGALAPPTDSAIFSVVRAPCRRVCGSQTAPIPAPAPGLWLVLGRLVKAPLIHTPLFCLIGENPPTLAALVALAGHPAFIARAKAKDLSRDSR